MKKAHIGVVLLLISMSSYAFPDEVIDTTTEQGAKEYDWQSCIDAKVANCMNGCENSEDKDCNDNCNTIANDKCTSQGLQPPQQVSQ